MTGVPFIVVRQIEDRARLDRAKLRHLEQQTGVQPTDQDGQAWLARSAALEHVHAEAMHTLKTGDTTGLEGACRVAESIGAPACRAGDHEARAA